MRGNNKYAKICIEQKNLSQQTIIADLLKIPENLSKTECFQLLKLVQTDHLLQRKGKNYPIDYCG